MRSFICYIIWALLFVACGEKQGNPVVEIETRFGNIEVELYPKQAPKSVATFLSYVDSGFYKNSSFYRVLNDVNQPSYSPKSEIIQGGIWKTNPRKAGSLPGIPHETTAESKLSHTDGTVSLARLEPGTANSEFFICIGDQPGYDFGGENNPDGQGYAAFGKVVKGMDVVRKIYNMPEDDQSFDPPVYIFDIKRK